ncbi:protein-tyrosine phosphatase family protein [Mesoterricola silvestris]|uniref:Tyrosine specific protein phosphatases domain-containing protein n=1 Tax=Mesoterricola silvestris TaxID=2927979 RepID=A0AA48GR75_9BACT|nr:hypothetical protein [Mesoterricola silvestris]BDU72735.1 hypothetical protein METEAL_19090 [Mesoterricola silvestris]
MLPLALLLPPALVAPEAPRPVLVEPRPGLYVLNGAPTAEIYRLVKQRHITHVIDFRTDAELGPEGVLENERIQELGSVYMRYALAEAPPAPDFVSIRALLQGLPAGSRVLVHCATGNRAAAAICPWLVLDRGMALPAALETCRQAGMRVARTDEAVRTYLGGI